MVTSLRILVSTLLLLVSCDSIRQEDSSVTELDFEPGQIFTDEQATLEISFEVGREPDGDTKASTLVLSVPTSSLVELESSTIEPDIIRLPNIVEECPDGSSSLIYIFEDGELDDLDFEDSRYLLTLGVSHEEAGVYRYEASNNIDARCDVGEKSELLFVIDR